MKTTFSLQNQNHMIFIVYKTLITRQEGTGTIRKNYWDRDRNHSEKNLPGPEPLRKKIYRDQKK